MPGLRLLAGLLLPSFISSEKNWFQSPNLPHQMPSIIFPPEKIGVKSHLRLERWKRIWTRPWKQRLMIGKGKSIQKPALSVKYDSLESDKSHLIWWNISLLGILLYVPDSRKSATKLRFFPKKTVVLGRVFKISGSRTLWVGLRCCPKPENSLWKKIPENPKPESKTRPIIYFW